MLMDMTQQFLAFWAIHDRLDVSRLMPQLDEMKRPGLDGVVWHPRFHPEKPEYLVPERPRVVAWHFKPFGI